MGLACGARSELSVDGDGSQPASEQAWTCTADGGACDGDAACCSLRCDARRCAPSACQPGDAPVRMVEVGDGRIFGWPALVLAAREVVYLTEAGGVLAVDKRGGEPRLITRTQVGAIPTSAVYADGAIFITTF